MSPRRNGDDEKENWRETRSRDIERFGIYIIGGLIVLASTLIGLQLNQMLKSIEHLNTMAENNEKLRTGNAAAIEILTIKFNDHAQTHKVVWTEKEKAEYDEIKTKLYRKWDYLSNTRGGKEILHEQPMKEIP